MLRLRKLEEEW